MTAAHIRRLTLSNFRSYRAADLSVASPLVALVGPNGAGKTNILEALSFLTPGRGLRRATLDEIAETSGFLADSSYFLVKNFINNTTFFEWDPATYNSYFRKIKGAYEITIPRLNEMACEQVELASVPFVSFVANKGVDGQSGNYSFVLRGYVRHWLGNVWAEFDRVKLKDAVGPEARKGQAKQERAN